MSLTAINTQTQTQTHTHKHTHKHTHTHNTHTHNTHTQTAQNHNLIRKSITDMGQVHSDRHFHRRLHLDKSKLHHCRVLVALLIVSVSVMIDVVATDHIDDIHSSRIKIDSKPFAADLGISDTTQ